MATIQKTTVRRYNGVDWDSIFFSTSADIVSLGAAHSIEGTEEKFTVGSNLEATDTMSTLMAKVINRMATLDGTVIPGLQAGSGVTSIDASKITGTLTRAQLPADVSGNGLEVASESAKNALTYEEVFQGDIVKVTGGAVYLCTKSDVTAVKYMKLNDETATVAWSRITGAPTTLQGYGITDGVNTADLVDVAAGNAGKVLKIGADGKLAADITGDAQTLGGQAVSYFATAADMTNVKDVVGDDSRGLVKNVADLQNNMQNIDASWVKTGTLPLSVIPHTALERIYTVTDASKLANLTTAQVQNGDTVKVADKDGVIGAMYLVADDTKLGTEDYMDGLVQYAAGTAASVAWSGVTDTPTTLAGYGITDAVSASEKVTEANAGNAGKILVLNGEGKLPVSITGDAQTLGGQAVSYFATAAAVSALTTTVGDSGSGLVKDVADLKAAIGVGGGGSLTDRIQEIEDAIGDEETPDTILYDIAQLEAGTTIAALAASKITGTLTRAQLPVDISGRTHKKASLDACYTDLTTDNAAVGDWVKLADGKLYVITDASNLANASGYTLMVDIAGTNIAWAKITGTPTTLSGYGITDAIAKTDVAYAGGAGAANKVVGATADGKLAFDITGDAATVGGHAANYFATAQALADLSLSVPVMVESESEIVSPKVGQMVIVPVVEV